VGRVGSVVMQSPTPHAHRSLFTSGRRPRKPLAIPRCCLIYSLFPPHLSVYYLPLTKRSSENYPLRPHTTLPLPQRPVLPVPFLNGCPHFSSVSDLFRDILYFFYCGDLPTVVIHYPLIVLQCTQGIIPRPSRSA